MKLLNSAVQISALTLAIGASFAATDAQAVEQVRATYTNPTGICQAALPNFEGAIRKRPLAVQNEGTTDSFITCSFTAQSGGITTVTVEFTNSNDSVRIMSCTGVSGYAGGPLINYLVKNVLMQPAGAVSSLTWNAADFPNAPAEFPSDSFSISCKLLPGTGINRSRVDFLEEIGT